MTTNSRCTKSKSCAGMEYAMYRPNGTNRTGLDFAHTFNMKTGRWASLGYLYRRDSKDTGIVLNLCPWCGTDFRKLWPREKTPAETRRTR